MSVCDSQVSTLHSVLSEPVGRYGGDPLTAAAEVKASTSGAAAVPTVGADQLTPFFNDLPKRRYAPAAIVRQQHLREFRIPG